MNQRFSRIQKHKDLMFRSQRNDTMKSCRGQALIIAVFFFVTLSSLMVMAASVPLLRTSTSVGTYNTSTESFYIGESGAEDVVFRLREAMQTSATQDVLIDGRVASVSVNSLGGANVEIISVGDLDQRVRKVRYALRVGEGASFNFGVQTDVGGFVMENSSAVNGNVFSNGTIVGSGNNSINGDAIASESGGLIEGVNIYGSGYGHTIRNSTIGKDAYYHDNTTLISTTVGGIKYPGSPDQPSTSMPISDEVIDILKGDAADGGITECSGTLTISQNSTIGPQKYTCNLRFRGNPTITLAGSIWVEGNIILENNPSFVVHPSLSGESVPLIADNPSNRLTSSQVNFQNSGFFSGAGQGSYIVMISQNESEEMGGSEYAINISNGASGDIFVYAAHGRILLQNNVNLKEVTAYKVHLQNSATVTYETGLANLLFTSGPSAGFVIDSWQEVE